MRITKMLSTLRKFCLIIIFLMLLDFLLLFYGKTDVRKIVWRDSSCKEPLRFSQPVDLVFTWVNGSDQSLIDSMLKYLPTSTDITSKRYRDWGTLRYALRSVEKHAGWFRHVYIVTNGQVPSWLNTEYQKVSIIRHSEIFKNVSHLPTFNSQAIECHIHRIPGLSKSFIYMNDDIFFGQQVNQSDFYTKETGIKIRFTGGRLTMPDYTKSCYEMNNDEIINTDKKIFKMNKRKLEDDECKTAYIAKLNSKFRNQLYAGSLLYTILVYDTVFGQNQLHAPAHAPLIIDIETMNELQNRFPEAWEMTSAKRFRDSLCIQYAFAYYHFILSSPQNSCRENTTHPVATALFRNEDYTYFATGNSNGLDKALDNLLRRRNKRFFCINDHMDNSRSDAEVARNAEVITKFLEAYFPEPSKFEKE